MNQIGLLEHVEELRRMSQTFISSMVKREGKPKRQKVYFQLLRRFRGSATSFAIWSRSAGT